ncbi:MAG: tetratricopeptide repeat protein [Bdellovibrionales bacterium]|nr:tetratricopeptide repeat protein [Bdellovibrionales bacterium]
MSGVSPLVSASPEKSFLENYGVLRNIPNLYIPVGWEGEMAADPNDRQQVLDFLDMAFVNLTPDMKVSLVYTNPSFAGPDTTLAELPTDVALERIFHNKNVQGVTFDGVVGSSNPAHTVYSFVLPMIVGMIRADAVDCDAMTHVGKARDALAKDKAYEAFFHAALARDCGAPKEHFYFLELECLMTLSLHTQVQQYYRWWDGEGMKQERGLFLARSHSLSGDTPGAFKLLKPYFKSGKVPAMAWLERGRALCISQRYDEAVAAFDKCLAMEPDNCDALVGKGISVRALHYASGNVEGLNQALECFKKVEQCGDYHVPEALHHAGTIHIAMQNWEEGEKTFRKTLMLRGSDVSRRNLALTLHAQGRVEEGRVYYNYLIRYCPEQAQGLEKYYQTGGQTYVINVGETPSIEERLTAYIETARERMKQLNMVWHGDVCDWRRFDDYVDYYAPGGKFLRGSALHGLEGADLQEWLLDISLHLAAIVVEKGFARWVIPNDQNMADVEIEFNEGCGVGKYNLFNSVLHRVEVGANADNLTNLEMLISMTSEFDEVVGSYRNPYPALPASPGRIAEFERRAARACTEMRRRGFNLTGDLNDLREIECIVMSLFQENGALKQMMDNDTLTDDFVFDIGFQLGMVCAKYYGGEWYDHDDVFGISIHCTGYAPIHPIRRLLKRIEYGLNADSITSLLSLEPALICADLTNKLREHEISTREELAAMLAEALPSVMDEDPSGKSLDRMVTMITSCAEIVRH